MEGRERVRGREEEGKDEEGEAEEELSGRQRIQRGRKNGGT